MKTSAALLTLFLVLGRTGMLPIAEGAQTDAAAQMPAEMVITQANLLRHIQELSSDAYTGRATGTEGENKSVEYIISQCRAIGLQPGAPDGTWTQEVPLWGMLPQGNTMSLSANGKQIALVAGTDYVAWSAMPLPKIDVAHSPLVFVGYGVVAPEYHRDDYAGTDVHGKTVLILSGDPPVADAADPSKLDEKMFLGRALTIHVHTGSKLEEAYKHGASAVILVSSGLQATPALFQNYTRETMILRGPHERDRVQAQALLSMARVRVFQRRWCELRDLANGCCKTRFSCFSPSKGKHPLRSPVGCAKSIHKT